LQSRQGNELVIGKLENSIKAGYCKDAFGYGGNAATDEPSSTELSQR
jgi:hypothetical protein